MNKILEYLLVLLIVLPLYTLYSAWVAMLLWNWFMPVIFGLPVLTMVQAYAANLVVSYATWKLHGGYGAIWTEDQELKRAGWALITPLTFVGLGYILTFFL